ncbi:MAG TPA: MBL fold metallo-hydrolase [Rheinheimera sp.]|nr:MBL fold metallo-hydrolase [Rheinheimera sp.]
MTLTIEHFLEADSNTFSYLVTDTTSNSCVVIDPVLNFDAASGTTSTQTIDAIVERIRLQQSELRYILETHVHADHVTASAYLKQQLGGQVAIGERITQVQQVFGELFHCDERFGRDGRQFDLLLHDEQELSFGAHTIKVWHTPGHTPACVSYLIGNNVFVGDTIFMPDFGTARCDFPGGDAHLLYQSIQRLFSLPGDTILWMCHDYGTAQRKELQWQTTVAAEEAFNIHVGGGKSADEFVAMRTARDATLSMPKLLLPSVQINMRAGHFPEPDSNGVSYLKLPLNQF